MCGPISPRSLGNACHFLTLIDCCTGYAKIAFLSTKTATEVSGISIGWIKEIERSTAKKVKAFRSDNGREYINEELIGQFREMGIRYETTVAGNPQTNGCAERFNQTGLCKVRSMLKQSGFPVTLWAEIASTAVFLHNMTPKLLNKNIPPYTAIFDKQLSAKRLVIIGTLMIARRQYNGKLTARGKKVYMVGYSDTKFGLRLYDPSF
jgi:hypothetical protein